MSLEVYLKNDVAKEYLELLPTRWAALLQRIAQQTQQLQKSSTSIMECDTLENQIASDFSLAQHLLESEHNIYMKGAALLVSMKEEEEQQEEQREVEEEEEELHKENSQLSSSGGSIVNGSNSRSNVANKSISYSAILSHLELFFQGFVTELTLKETMLAHWRSILHHITSDTLRVYTHAMLVHKQVSLPEIERLTFMLQNASRALC